MLTTLTSILLSFDLTGKSEVERREKRAGSWCHNYLFLMSLLVVSNHIKHHGNFKGKSRVTRYENNGKLLCHPDIKV